MSCLNRFYEGFQKTFWGTTKFEKKIKLFLSLRPGLGREWVKIVNSLSAYPTKWPNTLKQFVGNLPTNCLSVFEDFLGLAPNGLTHLRPNFHSYENQSADLQCKLIELFLWVENCFKWSTYHKKQKSNPTFFHINLEYLKSIFPFDCSPLREPFKF